MVLNPRSIPLRLHAAFRRVNRKEKHCQDNKQGRAKSPTEISKHHRYRRLDRCRNGELDFNHLLEYPAMLVFIHLFYRRYSIIPATATYLT
jgi:hypothetical protein